MARGLSHKHRHFSAEVIHLPTPPKQWRSINCVYKSKERYHPPTRPTPTNRTKTWYFPRRRDSRPPKTTPHILSYYVVAIGWTFDLTHFVWWISQLHNSHAITTPTKTARAVFATLTGRGWYIVSSKSSAKCPAWKRKMVVWFKICFIQDILHSKEFIDFQLNSAQNTFYKLVNHWLIKLMQQQKQRYGLALHHPLRGLKDWKSDKTFGVVPH